ncbi:TetR/AcrR family transcriptional regulator [Chelatococcus sp. SYSU_G07232]|uniref:TetR/AcrR family transcriptional regulator n=1 Tax=Chelatococcus albus TaxID=3047466 RepID=A0ABT7AGZ8_9HYPH|nr:TetR/AcrR family transcriptional regulator [Chelatococcus sp. SYSU_G07232]MDJ1158109.1 TetR/AcrR family transcriptional regulator [Chelatococcus sp. SYSU_G07232]
MARTRAQDYDAKRRTILHRSAELFAQFGYPGTSITMIAEACGVSKALLYHYYPDKEAVLFDILYAHLEELIAAVEQAAQREGDASARVYAIAAALLESYRDADAEHQVQIASLKLLPQEKQEQLRDMERVLVAILSDALAEALPAIGRGPLLKPLTMSMFGMLNWHYLWFREGKGLTRDDYARLVTRLVMAGAEEAAAALAGPAEVGTNTGNAKRRKGLASGARRARSA